MFQVDVDAGIAKRVGEVIKLSLATYVKKDGTLLVKVGGGNPAHPGDPCTRQLDPSPTSQPDQDVLLSTPRVTSSSVSV